MIFVQNLSVYLVIGLIVYGIIFLIADFHCKSVFTRFKKFIVSIFLWPLNCTIYLYSCYLRYNKSH